MKLLITLLSIVIISGCTPAIQRSFDATLTDVKTYDYKQLIQATGWYETGLTPIENPQLRY